MICQLGVLDCREKWIKVLTPMGVCFELEIQRAFEREFDSFSDLRSSFANNVLGLVAATNLPGGSALCRLHKPVLMEHQRIKQQLIYENFNVFTFIYDTSAISSNTKVARISRQSISITQILQVIERYCYQPYHYTICLVNVKALKQNN